MKPYKSLFECDIDEKYDRLLKRRGETDEELSAKISNDFEGTKVEGGDGILTFDELEEFANILERENSRDNSYTPPTTYKPGDARDETNDAASY